MNQLTSQGWTRIRSGISSPLIEALRGSVFPDGTAGLRCLLDIATVREAAARLRTPLTQLSILSKNAVAVQAIAFDKTPSTNWKASWPQDLMFPLARRAIATGYDLPTVKDGIDYARLPRAILENLLAVRLHLDECDMANGPLRVVPGSHRLGILKSKEIASTVGRLGEIACLARTGDAVLMRPLTLHASSPARAPFHRRVLHLVYYSGAEVRERWHRAI